jgi:O-antigen/teichoic acid export membrane protein
MSAAGTNLEAIPAVALGGRVSRALPWARKFATAVADQGLIAGSNFALGVVLARWLKPEGYGAYALAGSLYLLLAAFNQALLTEPLNVLGPSLYNDRLKEYLGRVLWIQAAIAVGISTALGISAAVAQFAGHTDLAGALFGLTLGAPTILLLGLARGACYVETAPARAASAATLYCAVMLGGVWIAYRYSMISAFAVFVLMGLASLTAGGVLMAQLKPRRSGTLTVREVWREHWNYGRWAIGSTLLTWIPGNIFYSVTGALLGMRDAGAYRGLMNLELPVTHTASAISLLFLPVLSRTFGRQGLAATRVPVWRVMGVYALGAAVYGGIFVAWQRPIFRALYGGNYMEYCWLAPWMLLGVVFQVSSYGPAVGLRAVQSPSSVFRVYGVAAAVSLATGIPATWAFGVVGAAAGTVLSNVACFGAALYLYRKKLSEGLS